MTSETTNPKSTSAVQGNGILEKSDSEKGKMSFAKVLLSGDNNSSKGTIVYSSTSKNTKPTTDIDSSSITNGNSNKGNRNNKKRNIRRNGNRIKNDLKTLVNDKLQESINEAKGKMSVSFENSNKNSGKVVLSPAPMPVKNAWFSGNSEILRKNLILEKEAKCPISSENNFLPFSTVPSIGTGEKNVKEGQFVKIESEEDQSNQRDKKIKNNNKKEKDKKHFENYNNGEVGEHVDKQVFINDDKVESVISANVDSVEISGNVSNDNVDNQQSGEKTRKKVFSKTVKKYHESPINGNQEDDGFDGDWKDSENFKDDTQYCYYDKGTDGYYYQNQGHQGWKKNGKNNVSSPPEKNISPRITGPPECNNLNGEIPVNDQSKDGSNNFNRRHKPYRGRRSGEHNSNEYDYRGNKQNNHYKERGQLPSWDEGAPNTGDGTEDGEDYMERLENQFKKMGPYYSLPSFDSTKVAEATAAVVSVEPQLFIPIPNLTHQAVIFPPDIATFNKFSNQPFITTAFPSLPHVPYTPYFQPQYRNPSFGSVMSVDQIKDCILRQIEYYLSEENLIKDFFIRRKMDENGYISLSLVAGFPKIKNLTNDINLVIEAMKCSTTLEMSDDYQFIRTKINPESWPLIDETKNTTEETNNVSVTV
ncbi:La-related protein 1 [Strongyloides ratti]|uniref:La-related protein 1 n=1 Tax=Strongyloides ratti TaxID=34506 RepID=A0A090LIF9_STRRB|nr:La-related protein 1 [Strongyloides ratti]CEF67260.1 La-related protein 1 [Strongyloides ratti]